LRWRPTWNKCTLSLSPLLPAVHLSQDSVVGRPWPSGTSTPSAPASKHRGSQITTPTIHFHGLFPSSSHRPAVLALDPKPRLRWIVDLHEIYIIQNRRDGFLAWAWWARLETHAHWHGFGGSGCLGFQWCRELETNAYWRGFGGSGHNISQLYTCLSFFFFLIDETPHGRHVCLLASLCKSL